jgi:uncharacterized protein YggE
MRNLAGAFVAVLSLASPATAQEAARPATLAVRGAGEAQLKPDFARILVAVGTQADTVAQAVEGNRVASERVLARIQGLGVKREDIQTANFQVIQTPPRVGPDGREQRVPRFTARHLLRLTTRDIESVGRLAGEILASGDMTFQSLAWGLDREADGADGARRAAVDDARRQAAVYAQAAGVKLGRLLEMRDGSVQSPGMHEADMPMTMRGAPSGPEVPVVPPASLRYESTVQMVWEIAP